MKNEEFSIINSQLSILNYQLTNPIHNILKIDTTMNVKIQLSDEAYKTLVNGNGRLYIKLPHGRASVGDSHVRLTLRIALDEADIVPADAIMDESRQASDFVDRVFDTEF